jgi:hypothetical protein
MNRIGHAVPDFSAHLAPAAGDSDAQRLAKEVAWWFTFFIAFATMAGIYFLRNRAQLLRWYREITR